MMVACPECGTRFSLDDSRISGDTAKVRCSRCRHVFRINRGGQVLAPLEEPPAAPVGDEPPAAPLGEELPAAPVAEEPPGPEVVEETSVPPAAEAVEPPPALEPAPEEVEAPQTAAALEGVRALLGKKWLWVGVSVLILVVMIGGLGWWAWQGSSEKSTDAVQGLDQQPAPAAPDAQAGSSTPAPLMVTPPPPPATAPELQNLPVDWAKARYEGLVNPKGGQILVIRGEVANKGKKLRGPIRLKAILTDAQHRPLREEVVYAGTTLTDEELKTLDPDKIKSWLAQPGGRSQDQELKPGEKQPFTVVFFGVPANLAESRSGFQLVVVEGPEAKGGSARN